MVICFRILAFITNLNEIGREQIRTAGNDLLKMSWQYFPFTCRKEEEWNFIDGLMLHVYEMRHLTQETRKLFQSDMRIVVDFLAEGENYCSNRKIIHKAALFQVHPEITYRKGLNGWEKPPLQDK